jgi:hypothetical protein
MRAAVLIIFLILGVLLPTSVVRLKADTTSVADGEVGVTSSATPQATQFRTPPPEVTASGAAWQANNEPIVVSGLLYTPTREQRMFDGQVMAQIDVYQRVPVYADTTREPYTIVYVPLSRDRLRAYERAPVTAFPVPSGRGATAVTPLVSAAAPEPPQPVATTGTIVTTGPARTPSARSRRAIADAVPRGGATTGIWVEYGGTRWYSSGAAAPYSPERFTKIGEHRGFPVYRDRERNSDQIWIAVVNGGPLAPYQRR